MNDEHSQMAMISISQAASMAGYRIQEAAAAYDTPSAIFRPTLSIDGNQWCALYGEDLHDGVAGFGSSPAEAYADFDKSWYAKLNPAEAKQ